MKKTHSINALIGYITLIFSFTLLAGNNYWLRFSNKGAYAITVTPVHSYCVYAFVKQSFTLLPGQQTLPIELRSNNSGSCFTKSAHAQYTFKRTDSPYTSLGWINFWMNYQYFTGDTNGSCNYTTSNLCSDGTDKWGAYNLNMNNSAGVTFNY